MYSFDKRLRHAGHTRRYTIQTTGSGWEVREELDSQVVRQARYQDWHRVELARRVFVIKAVTLCEQGWQEV